MKKLLILFILALMITILPACNTTGTGDLEGKKWILESYGELSNPQPVQGPRQITVEFNKADRRVSGNGGCNQYGAEYTLNGNKITIGMIMSTEMACQPEMTPNEGTYFEMLRNVNEYKIENGKLILSGTTGALIYHIQ